MSQYAQKFETYRSFLNRVVHYNLDDFEIPRDARILDIGCAFGEDIRRLREKGYKNVSGVEPDPYCVERCADLDVRVGSLEQTGFPDGQFDVVLVDNVFHHVPDYGLALKEVSRVLRPKGWLCFIEPRPSVLRLAMDYLTFKTPLPRLVGGPVLMRYTIMSEEVASGLYPQWLRSQDVFLPLLRESFEVAWLRKHAFFYSCKAQKKSNKESL
jgi:SAM-dependent methyltransferase